MSAYQVNNDHLDLLVTAGFRGVGSDATLDVFHNGEWVRFNKYEHADTVKEILYKANLDSVNYRYNEGDTGKAEPYSGAEIAQYIGGPVIPWGHILGALRCYEYQACETPEWGTSLAHGIIEKIRFKVCQAITDEAGGMWEWSRDDAQEIIEAIKAGLVRA